jgi:ketosteroid isomerase-like protein
MKANTAAAALLLAALAACSQGAPPPAVDAAAELAKVNAAEAAQISAINAKNLDGALAIYAPDAEFAASGAPPASGAEELHAELGGFLADPNLHLAVTPGKGEVSASGDLAYITTTYELTTTDPATHQPVTSRGNSIMVWKKGADGAWQAVADYNVEAPPAAP